MNYLFNELALVAGKIHSFQTKNADDRATEIQIYRIIGQLTVFSANARRITAPPSPQHG